MFYVVFNGAWIALSARYYIVSYSCAYGSISACVCFKQKLWRRHFHENRLI